MYVCIVLAALLLSYKFIFHEHDLKSDFNGDQKIQNISGFLPLINRTINKKKKETLIDAFDFYLTAFEMNTPHAKYEQNLFLLNALMKFTLSCIAIDLTPLLFILLYFLIWINVCNLKDTTIIIFFKQHICSVKLHVYTHEILYFVYSNMTLSYYLFEVNI